MRFYLAVFSLIFVSTRFISAQAISNADSINVNFIFEVDGIPIELGKPMVFKNGSDTVTIDRLRFYVNDLRWENEQRKTNEPEDSYRLVDAAIPRSKRFTLPSQAQGTALYFGFGVDSLTNDAGVHGGDLDPTRDMYWAWQTGYINFKLEGTSTSTCERFTYHLGGFLDGYDCSSLLKLQFDSAKVLHGVVPSEIELVFDLTAFLSNAKQLTGCQIMRPAKEAVALASLVEKCFAIRQ